MWSSTESLGEIVDYGLNLSLTRLPGATGVYLGGEDFVMCQHPG